MTPPSLSAKRRPGPRGLLTIVALTLFVIALNMSTSSAQSRRTWEVRSSVVVEAVCFVNALVGDPYFLRFFQADYAHFSARFRPHVREALSRIRAWKERDQIILSSRLLTLIPDLTDKTLDDLIAAVEQPGKRYNMTAEQYAVLAPDLKTVFTFLRDENFVGYWKTHRQPEVLSKIAEFKAMTSIVDIVPSVERVLGHTLEAQKSGMILLVVAYVVPNSIALSKYTLVPPATSAETLVRTSIHELLHAFEAKQGSVLERALMELKQDEFIMDRFRNRDPAYGYNTFESYVEEDIARALDQQLTERLGIGVNPRWRWLKEDGGMHVLAAALDYLMKRESFAQGAETFPAFYVRMAKEGKIGPGKIEGLYDDYYLRRLWVPAVAILLLGVAAFIGYRKRRKAKTGAPTAGTTTGKV